MKSAKSVFLFVAISLMTASEGYGQLNLPAYSPRAEFTQDFALTTLKMGYGRPGVKNRKVFGGIVPFGEIWRAGANDRTIFNISDDITVNGNKLEKGEYVILTIPGETEWKVIFNKNPKTDYTNYIKEDDVLIVDVKPTPLKEMVETFTISTSNITDKSLDLYFAWEKTELAMKLVNEIDSEVRAEFDQKLAGPSPSDYYSMARYLYNIDGDMKKALEYINIAGDKNLGYGNLRYKGLILAKLGKDNEAIEFLTKSRDRAAANNNSDYIRINELSIKEIKGEN